MKTPRRIFLTGAAAAITAGLVGPLQAPAWQKSGKSKSTKPAKEKEEEDDDVSANEDLMREHGVLNRILLIYDEAGRRIQAKESFDTEIVGRSAGLITRFIEDYHAKIEETWIFPRFEQAHNLVELTVNLRAQHAMGRRLTESIAASAKTKDLTAMATAMASFIRMYRPHEAREDTVLFPALHKLVSRHEYDAMGEQFEKFERKTFGGDGFDMAVDQVTELEKQFGIYDISQFTPR